MDVAPCRITVSRRPANDVRDRQVIVSLDGEPLVTLLFGEEVTRQIAPGAYRLRAHNTLFLEDGRRGAAARGTRAVRRDQPAGTRDVLAPGLLGAGPLYLTFERVDGGTP